MVHSLLSLKSTSEFRSLSSPLEKCLWLHEKHQVSWRKLSEEFKISKSSLSRAKRAVKEQRTPRARGRPRSLLSEEEKQLVECVHQFRRDYGEDISNIELTQKVNINKKNFLHIESCEAEQIISTRKQKLDLQEEVILDRNFPKRFCSRNNFLLRTPRKLEVQRIEGGRFDILDHWYERLGKKIEEKKYLPALMANMDETMLSCKDRRIKVIIPVERKTGIHRLEKESEHITLIMTLFGDATMGKTGVILPLQHLPFPLEDLASSYAWGGTSSGWITRDIFSGWVQNVFIPEITRRRTVLHQPKAPALLFLDAHDSRECPEALEWLKEVNVDVMTFEPHVTHICQPLDVGFFSSFKRNLSRFKWQLRGFFGGERRKKLLLLAKEAIHIASYPDHLQKSWEKVGLIPFNKELVLKGDLVSPTTLNLPVKKKSGRLKIAGTFLSDSEVIEAIRKRDEEKRKKDETKGTKKRGRPRKKQKEGEEKEKTPQVRVVEQ